MTKQTQQQTEQQQRTPVRYYGHAVTKAQAAWTARVAGASWRQAAEAGGFANPQSAMKAVRTCYGSLPTLTRDDTRDLWRDRLEMLWRQALADALERRPGAITSAVRVATAAIQLDGLAEPVAVALDVSVLRALDGYVTELVQ